MAIKLNQLPEKFLPSLLGTRQCTAPEPLQKLFQQCIQQKTHLQELPDRVGGSCRVLIHPNLKGWVIKQHGQEDTDSGRSDTFVYRIRKAKKIAQIIQKYSLNATVPEKWLHYTEKKQGDKIKPQWTIFATRVEFADNYKKYPQLSEAWLTENNKRSKAQCASRYNNRTTALTKEHLRAAAIITFEANLTDWLYSNVCIDKKGRLAIIDTEPMGRGQRKKWWSNGNLFAQFFTDKRTSKLNEALLGITQLKSYAVNPKCKRALVITSLYYLAQHALIVGAQYALIAGTWAALGTLSVPIAPLLIKSLLTVKASVLALEALYTLCICTDYFLIAGGEIL